MKALNSIKLSKGFTLIELMIVIAIASILMTLAVPSFSLMINNSKVTSTTNEFISSLNLARSEALKRSGNVSVCKSNASYTACDTTAATFTTNGWLVFSDTCGVTGVIDSAAATATTPACTDVRIKVGEANDQISIKEDVAAGAADIDVVTYNLSGRVAGTAPAFLVETLTGNTRVKKNQVSINRIGRVRSCRLDSSNNCVN